MTTMVFCRGCGKQIHETAPMCPGCGAPQRPAQARPAPEQPAAGQAAAEVRASWRRRFDLLEKAGGPKMPKVRDLSFGERMRLMFNVWGFLFGPFYYLAKGMWKRAITLFAVAVALIVVIAVVISALHLPDGFLSFIGPVIFATRANIDYYKKMVLGDNGWW
jgi:hypothetical protein